ncbi:OB-fold nucleic acid binding domain-containing protein [Niabella sp. W65]|nr:OB-fold nucleic acid binding domain-containing protein [Niabella sp. W65]MCH7361581.1 OB-fold nucleic acid binding domain-containing protein [Niabella sp. W65]
MGIFTFNDLLQHFPFRHVDKTKFTPIGEATPADEYLQFAGILEPFQVIGQHRAKRLIAQLRDKTGTVELVWFSAINMIQKMLQPGQAYIVYGKLSWFMSKPQLVHPEIEAWSPEKTEGKAYLEPVYPSTEKLKAKNLGGRQIGKLTQLLLPHVKPQDIPENFPQKIIEELKLVPRFEAYRQIHFPQTPKHYEAALRRLKFEEIFIAQMRMNLLRSQRHRFSKGVIFDAVGDYSTPFTTNTCPLS